MESHKRYVTIPLWRYQNSMARLENTARTKGRADWYKAWERAGKPLAVSERYKKIPSILWFEDKRLAKARRYAPFYGLYFLWRSLVWACKGV